MLAALISVVALLLAAKKVAEPVLVAGLVDLSYRATGNQPPSR